MRGVHEAGSKPLRRDHVDKKRSAEAFKERVQRTHPLNMTQSTKGAVMRGGIRL